MVYENYQQILLFLYSSALCFGFLKTSCFLLMGADKKQRIEWIIDSEWWRLESGGYGTTTLFPVINLLSLKKGEVFTLQSRNHLCSYFSCENNLFLIVFCLTTSFSVIYPNQILNLTVYMYTLVMRAIASLWFPETWTISRREAEGHSSRRGKP